MTSSITTTLGVLVQAEPALAALAALKLPAKSAYHVKKLATLVAQETQHFQDARNGYIKELGVAQPDGSVSIAPDSPALPTFVEKVTELIAVEVVIPWGPLTLAMLGDEKVSAADLQALGPLFAEPDGENA
jgi:hypothetical protein